MKRNIILETKKLCDDYTQDKITLEEFQFQLEPLLGSYDLVSREDEEFIKKTINDLELIIYTVPKDIQKEKVYEFIPKILSYVEHKK